MREPVRFARREARPQLGLKKRGARSPYPQPLASVMSQPFLASSLPGRGGLELLFESCPLCNGATRLGEETILAKETRRPKTTIAEHEQERGRGLKTVVDHVTALHCGVSIISS